MKWSLEGFGASLSPNCKMSSYKENGVILYDDQILTILYGFNRNKESVDVIHSVKINPVPAIDKSIVIKRIHALTDGSKVILISEKEIFVVLISPEVQSLRSLRSEYYCECVLVHRCLQLNNRLSTVCERIVPNSAVPQLAVLFSDSSIRFFSLSAIDEYSETLNIDFLPFMSMGGDINSSNRLGFLKVITSFDFVSTNGDKIVAIDSDGDMFMVYLSGQSTCSIKPLLTPPSLPCDPIELRNVLHPFSDIFTVLSIFTPSQCGVVSHLILVESENEISVSIHEQMQLPALAKTVSFLSSDRTCSYLISAENRLYFMDIRPWIVLYGQELTNGSNASLTLPDSRLHTMAVSCETTEDDSKYVGQVALANCQSQEEDDAISMFVCFFGKTRMVTSFLKCEIGLSTRPVGSQKQNDVLRSFKEVHIDPILAQKHILPKVISISTLPELQRIEETEKWIKNFTENIKISRDSVAVAIKRAVEIQPEIEQNEKLRQSLNERLLHLFDSVADIKYKVEKKQATVRQLFNRLATLTTRVAGTMPLNSQEEKMLSVLKEYKNQVLNYAVKMPQLSIAIADEKRKAFGPSVPFEPSINSRLNTINKLTCEVEAITTRLQKLSDRYDVMEKQCPPSSTV